LRSLQNERLLDLQVDDAMVVAGGTAVAAGRVRNRTSDEIRVVLLAQGLPSSWCPPVQVLRLMANTTVDVFIYLNPPLGTAPGRYGWTLTAQTADRPLQAGNGELTVSRPPAAPRRAEPRRRRRHRVAVVAALALVAVLVSLKLVSLHDGRPETLRRTAMIQSSETTARSAGPVEIRGTVVAPGRIRAAVARVSARNLMGEDQKATRTRYRVRFDGGNWRVSLPAGLYRVTFRRAGYEPESVMVNTLTNGSMTLAPLELVPRSSEKVDGRDDSGEREDQADDEENDRPDAALG
jgi:hypothetical protein